MKKRPTPNPRLDALRERLKRLGLYGLLAHAEDVLDEPWLERVLEIEDTERQRRSLVDELGYLSYDNRYADLLFEVVTRRYQNRPTVLTTNKPFSEWNEVFPNAACVVTLVDRLVHKAEIVSIEAASYRLKEAKDRTAAKARSRAAKKAKTKRA